MNFAWVLRYWEESNNKESVLIIVATVFRVNASNAEGTFVQSTEIWKSKSSTTKLCLVGIHWMTVAEYSQMSTQVPGFQSFFRFCSILSIIGQITNE